ncbi:PepSY-associated TM helix domain-containing protein [Undibacterium sp.]|jgi:sulfite reductase (NADPH) flavoprotein alpha-component|uniref:PepSY-associated TM helix domain-containing protein n=1 Tax=Undibacterium sp. TaxID=1914977 RepID=UPI002C31C781|nr:PepSY-associated TM helix domain-containing protein [Undibacterium sp.]HTD05804.1 PepSY-associated TM helix domain-containing protein [Undibacterium sp.]
MLKRFWFQLHWLMGISAGLILALVGTTGGLYAFEDRILKLLNPEVTQVHAGTGPMLEPAELLARLQVNRPYVSSLTLSGSSGDAARVGFMLPVAGSDKKKFELHYVNPYTAELLGTPRGEEFFRLALNLHRNLTLGDTGKAVTGASALVLVFMCLSGLYLRWAGSNAWNWRAWFSVDMKRSGRGFLSDLHAVIASWLLLMYLLAALTGLYWSYGWYRDWISNLAMPVAQKNRMHSEMNGGKKAERLDANAQTAPNLPAVWRSLRAEVAAYDKLIMLLPSRPGQPVQILYVDEHSPHPYANSKLALDAHTGEILKREPYADKTAGGKFLASIYALHSGSYWGTAGMLAMMLASLAMPLFAVTGWMMYLARRKSKSISLNPS